ncbi:MAG: ATP-binding protein [Oscillospiraceae bacterium]|nr:ATP-binding protein [Oscillospiraceae bacterium]
MNSEEKNSVLIIDDEKANIIKLSHILGSEYTLYASKGGQNGICTAKSNRPDVILLDILMPEMDGYEVLAILKSSEETKEIPVIFVTGLTNTIDEEKGLALGAADYITKPFNSTIVKLRVGNQINAVNQTRLKIEKEAAEQSNKAKTEFLSRISHEMLTPMNTVMGMLQLARMKAPGKETLRIYDEIDGAAFRLLELINDMLDIYAVEKKNFKLVSANFVFADMIDNVLKIIEPCMNTKKHRFSSNIDQTIPDTVTGDESRLAQVLHNLLANAAKFTPEGGEIQLRIYCLSEESGLCTLQAEVIDNGIGMTKKEQTALSRVFEQGIGGAARKYGGMGLGIPISKHIVEEMGGRMWFESEEGKGTRFFFTFRVGS